MEIKLSGAWLDVATLTKDLSDVITTANKIIDKGYKVCVIAVEAVEVEDAKVELLAVDLT